MLMRELSMNRTDLWDLTLGVPTMSNPVPDPIAVAHLDNQSCDNIFNWTGTEKMLKTIWITKWARCVKPTKYAIPNMSESTKRIDLSYYDIKHCFVLTFWPFIFRQTAKDNENNHCNGNSVISATTDSIYPVLTCCQASHHIDSVFNVCLEVGDVDAVTKNILAANSHLPRTQASIIIPPSSITG